MTRRKGPSLNNIFALTILILIGLGVAMFFIYRPPVPIETDLFVPIKSNVVSKSIRVVSPHPAGLDVRVKGSRQAITMLSQFSLSYPLQFPKSSQGVQTVAVEADKIELPEGITIVQIQPRMITARIEERLERKLAIEPILVGTPAAGHVVANTVLTPSHLSVRGPGSVLAELTRIFTKPVDVTDMAAPYKNQVVLDLPDEVEVAVRIPIFIEITFKKTLKVKTLSGINIEGRNTEMPFRISPPFLDLTIEGPDQVVENVTSDPSFQVYVDLKGLEQGVFVRRAVILLPLNSTLVKATPEVFTVHIGSVNEEGG